MSTAPLELPDVTAWETWLAAHHGDEGGVWLRIAKSRSPLALIRIEDALQGALCFGWIDSQRRSLDEHSYLQRYSRRRRGSPWSQENVERVERLTAVGRMRPPGLAEVAAARADGRWDAAYVAQRNVVLVEDLAAVLAADPRATARWEALGKTARYDLILPLLKARTPAARERRLQRAIDALTGD